MKGKHLPPHTPPFFVVPLAVNPKHPTTNSSVANVTLCGIAIQRVKEIVGRLTEQIIDAFVPKRDCPKWRVKARTKLRRAVQIRKKPPPHPILFVARLVEHPKHPNTN